MSESGRTYEDEYGGWLKEFKAIAESTELVMVDPCPSSWFPLVWYLGGTTGNGKIVERFPEDWLVGKDIRERTIDAEDGGQLRTLVEMCCAIRPELIDALWKSDCQWNTVGRRHQHEKGTIVVANYGAYTRPELLEYDFKLQAWVRDNPGHFGCVVSACAADKPYPAAHHKAIAERLPDKSWHQVTATGVLGIIPEELWPVMPHYDSGMPNLWRCMAVAHWYFSKMDYTRIVVYSDFYNRALMLALGQLANSAEIMFVHSMGPRAEYLDLCDDDHLTRLEDALATVSFGGRPLTMRS